MRDSQKVVEGLAAVGKGQEVDVIQTLLLLVPDWCHDLWLFPEAFGYYFSVLVVILTVGPGHCHQHVDEEVGQHQHSKHLRRLPVALHL